MKDFQDFCGGIRNLLSGNPEPAIPHILPYRRLTDSMFSPFCRLFNELLCQDPVETAGGNLLTAGRKLQLMLLVKD